VRGRSPRVDVAEVGDLGHRFRQVVQVEEAPPELGRLPQHVPLRNREELFGRGVGPGSVTYSGGAGSSGRTTPPKMNPAEMFHRCGYSSGQASASGRNTSSRRHSSTSAGVGSCSPRTFMNESRIERRIHLGNWCNQSGAGLGERPKAAPEPGIDAYVWIKPPGESDGSSTQIDNDEGKGFDRMCDPTYTGNPRNNNMSGALTNAPLSGHWFSAQFQQLMQNAYPPL
jgi:hypothetical protein